MSEITDLSDIQPVIDFQHYSTVFVCDGQVSEIVVAIHKKDITHWSVPPLDAAVDVEIVGLCIQLQEAGPE